MLRFASRCSVMVLLALMPGLSYAAGTPARSIPDTETGRRAAAWLDAYGRGDDAMRTFFEKNVSPDQLAERPVEARLQFYHRMRGDFGAFTLLGVLDSADDHVRLRLRGEHGEEVEATVLCAAAPPHWVEGIRMEPVGEAPAPAPAPAPRAMSDAEASRWLRTLVDSLSGAGAFSGAVLVERGGKELFREARGLADAEKQVPNRMDTRFNLGSINKKFTEVAIRQLAAAGRLGLDDTIARYLPDYPSEKGARITIRQLLDHRGGTGDIFNARYAGSPPGRFRSIADWMDLIRDQPLEFEPGTKQQYSNAGFVLLGAIIEHVSGESYYDYVRRHIFEPAGMTATASLSLDERGPGVAIGYTLRGEGATPGHRVANTDHLPWRGSSAGGGYSTADDLLRFVRALDEHKLGLDEDEGGMGIAGGSPGVNAAVENGRGLTVIVLANQDPPAAEQLARTIRLTLGGPSGGRRMGGPGQVEVGAGAKPGGRD
jgi:D-alanyl-D-alanine carboxypeptidase